MRQATDPLRADQHRHAPKLQTVSIVRPDGKTDTHKLPLEQRDYVEQRIDGLPPSQVSEYSAADLKKIRAASARKKVGFASNQETIFFQDGFDFPIKDLRKQLLFEEKLFTGSSSNPNVMRLLPPLNITEKEADVFVGILSKVLEASLKVVSDNEIEGYRISDAWAKEQHVYFVIQFSKPFKQFGLALDETIKIGAKELKGTDVKGYVKFDSNVENSENEIGITLWNKI